MEWEHGGVTEVKDRRRKYISSMLTKVFFRVPNYFAIYLALDDVRKLLSATVHLKRQPNDQTHDGGAT